MTSFPSPVLHRWHGQFARAVRDACRLPALIEEDFLEPELHGPGTIPPESSFTNSLRALRHTTRKDLRKMTLATIRSLWKQRGPELYEKAFALGYENGNDFLHAALSEAFRRKSVSLAQEELFRCVCAERLKTSAHITPQPRNALRFDFIVNREVKYLRRGMAFLAAAHAALYNRKPIEDAVKAAKKSVNHLPAPEAEPAFPAPRLAFDAGLKAGA